MARQQDGDSGDDEDDDDNFSDAQEEVRGEADTENPFSDAAMWSSLQCDRPSLADELGRADDESRDFQEATVSAATAISPASWSSSSDGRSWPQYIFSPTRRSVMKRRARNWASHRAASSSSSMTADFGGSSSSGGSGSSVEGERVAVVAAPQAPRPHGPLTPDSLLSLPTPRLDLPLTGYCGYATGSNRYFSGAGDEELGLRREAAFMGVVLGFVSGLMLSYALLLYGSAY